MASLIDKIRKNKGKALTAVLASFIGAQAQPYNSCAQNNQQVQIPEGAAVVLSPVMKNDTGEVIHEAEPGQQYTLEVLVSNDSLNGLETAEVRWKMIYSPNLDIVPIQPTPHYESNDVFEGMEMEEENYYFPRELKVSENSRAAKSFIDIFEGTSKRDGFANKHNKLLGKYNLKVSETAVGQQGVSIFRSWACSDISEIVTRDFAYPTKNKIFSIAVKPKEQLEPVVALTSDSENDAVAYLAGKEGVNYALEHASSLEGPWTEVMQTSGSGKYILTNGMSALSGFYRAKTK